MRKPDESGYYEPFFDFFDPESFESPELFELDSAPEDFSSPPDFVAGNAALLSLRPISFE